MDLLQTLSEQWAAQSYWELLAVVLAIGYVWLAARQNIWCWPCALVSTGIYSWLFWAHTLPLQTLLNVYYLGMAVYGWWHWRAMADHEPGRVQTRSNTYHLLAVLLLLPLSLVIGWSLQSYFNNEHLYVDALVTVFSLFTTYLVTQKVLENWLYWLAINSLAAWLYWQTGLYLTALLFVGYLGFALYGYLKWRSSYLAQDAHAIG
ncbi:nicotinamide riboside transporter PnuC [Bowmanella sp. Y26]|uniref:nicotinamide riboside transporter PnuC n=1 Tax=Bowmanella yangjiangensis TaxID=2811230 RepID=UPI001BDC8F5A|nr:nicotinamide riboside transporter PnuC [Bowmanella yangjiangensis]MBT1065743.1 nicotinamide riboside transporter PnuC [Bowmanella yangjiangensis]